MNDVGPKNTLCCGTNSYWYNVIFLRSSANLHPTPFDHSEQVGILKSLDAGSTDNRSPKLHWTIFLHARLSPQSKVILINTSKEHEDTKDDIGHRLEMKRCGSLVDELREESQCDIFVLEERRKPVASQKVSFKIVASQNKEKMAAYVMKDVRAST